MKDYTRIPLYVSNNYRVLNNSLSFWMSTRRRSNPRRAHYLANAKPMPSAAPVINTKHLPYFYLNTLNCYGFLAFRKAGTQLQNCHCL